MAPAITTTQVSKAAGELAHMRRSLAGWLKYRTLNDRVLAGTVTTLRKPIGYAQRVIAGSRDVAAEQDLADKLHTLLSEIMPQAQLPSADLRSNPQGAVQLAQIALSGSAPVMSSGPAAVGAFPGATHPWLWPVLIVGGLLLAVTTAIKTAADVAKDSEEKACIEAGACTDYGFWLKAASVIGLSWFAWTQLGVGEVVRSFTKKGRS